MKRMSRLMCLLGLSALGLGGCVAQNKYDAVAEANQTSAARLESLNQENRTLSASVDAKQRRIDQLEGEVRQLRGINDDLNSQISGVRGRVNQLVDEFGNIRLTMLDPETDRALQALAAQYPDLIRYDAARGMVQFVSDLTFDSGSDTVRPQARQSLQRLAQILTGSSASGYDLEVQGHTDSQKPARSAARFPTNRHLSLARAMSVERVLQESGVASARIKTSGWGEYRPVVQNNPTGGTPQNRRVEIYIMGSSGSASLPPASSSPAPAPSRPAPREEMPMK